MELLVEAACHADREPAVEAWQAANAARGLAPTVERIARVHDKVGEVAALLVVARTNDTVVAMALAEPGRLGDGAGEVVPGHGHVSMVFVAPEHWGQGTGRALMSGLHQEVLKRSWSTLTLWTRETNTPAQRLYRAAGYRRSGRASSLPSGDQIVQLYCSTSVGGPSLAGPKTVG